MFRIIRTVIFLLTFSMSGSIIAQAPAIYKDMNKKSVDQAPREFQFIAYFYNHVVHSNYYPTSDFLKGQTVGRLFGPNTSITSSTEKAYFFEQRIIPFFIYSPKLFNGKATLRASFEIDFTWGDGAYGTGGNSGSAISADQVNLQTQNIEIEYIPAYQWTVNLGLQRLFDTPHDTYRTFVDRLTTTSNRLNLWGTDAIGISVRKNGDYNKYKGGFYQLYENEIQSNDDVYLVELQYNRQLNSKWTVGGSLYHLTDHGNGQGGPSIVSQGLNSSLADFNGAFRFNFGSTPYNANIWWAGFHTAYNESYMMDTWFGSAYARYNGGKVKLNENEEWIEGPSIGGVAANLRAGYRHGQTENDLVWLDAMYTTGDQSGLADNKYSGVMTGNTWAMPGSLHIGHGGYLLFPHGNVVNRYIAAVTDISNMGFGISALHINAAKDIIPYKLNLKVGGAGAKANATPQGGGTYIGTEANLKLSYQLGVFMSLEWHTAYMWLGDFYDSRRVNGGVDSRPVNPYTSFVSFKWLMF